MRAHVDHRSMMVAAAAAALPSHLQSHLDRRTLLLILGADLPSPVDTNPSHNAKGRSVVVYLHLPAMTPRGCAPLSHVDRCQAVVELRQGRRQRSDHCGRDGARLFNDADHLRDMRPNKKG